jgi:prefoldin subunit 5
MANRLRLRLLERQDARYRKNIRSILARLNSLRTNMRRVEGVLERLSLASGGGTARVVGQGGRVGTQPPPRTVPQPRRT